AVVEPDPVDEDGARVEEAPLLEDAERRRPEALLGEGDVILLLGEVDVPARAELLGRGRALADRLLAGPVQRVGRGQHRDERVLREDAREVDRAARGVDRRLREALLALAGAGVVERAEERDPD